MIEFALGRSFRLSRLRTVLSRTISQRSACFFLAAGDLLLRRVWLVASLLSRRRSRRSAGLRPLSQELCALAAC